MKKLISILLACALLLGLAGCAHEGRPGSSGESFGGSSELESSQASAEPESSVSEQATPAPVETPEGSDSTYPVKEPTYHDWDGSGTLYPYAVFADPWVGEAVDIEQGVLIPSHLYLNYWDFASGQLVKFCFRPNCQHTGSDCDALVSNSSAWCFVANDKFYYLDTARTTTAYNEDLEEYAAQADLYVSSLNRSSEKKIGTIPVQSVAGTANVQLVLYGNSAFLFHRVAREDTVFGQDRSPETTYACVYMTEIDLKSDSIVNSQIIGSGYYWCSMSPESAYGGGIYLMADLRETPPPDISFELSGNETIWLIDGVEYTYEEWTRYSKELFTRKYFRYDIVTGELEERTDAFPDEYGGPLVDNLIGIYGEPNGLRPLAKVNDWYFINDGDLKAYNLKTGKVQTVLENTIKKSVSPVPNSNKIIVLTSSEEDEAVVTVMMDLDTGRRSEIPALNDGQYDISLGDIYCWTDDTLYARGTRWEEAHSGTFVYVRVDLTNGFEANEWEEYTLF